MSAHRNCLLRSTYIAAAAASATLASLTILGEFDEVIGVAFSRYAAVFALGLVAIAFLALAIKPMWWGKLLCAWVASSWLFAGVVLVVFFELPNPALWFGVAGITVMVTGLVHQFMSSKSSNE